MPAPPITSDTSGRAGNIQQWGWAFCTPAARHHVELDTINRAMFMVWVDRHGHRVRSVGFRAVEIHDLPRRTVIVRAFYDDIFHGNF